jgi:hypothetical protein
MANWLEELRALMNELGFKQVKGRDAGCVKFEKAPVSVETCDNAETFEVTHPGEHGAVVKNYPVGINQLRDYLQQIGC